MKSPRPLVRVPPSSSKATTAGSVLTPRRRPKPVYNTAALTVHVHPCFQSHRELLRPNQNQREQTRRTCAYHTVVTRFTAISGNLHHLIPLLRGCAFQSFDKFVISLHPEFSQQARDRRGRGCLKS
ncbi:hypothetical protein PoB_002991800 [Plakobranchus ocellatus]|uniref:Uncharacterized protein n=1 Tax=Plakobranchus ocellatus TaxID=259542 RepID=A0AAV4A855_9GAST|nr:hypothetical protein PoB_002991800 [Plakobranchus ocellatus]